MTTVNETALEEAHERLAHGARELGRQRVGGPRPIRRRADRLQLLENDAAGFLDELLGATHEFGAPDVGAGLALLRQHLLDDILRRDPGVVGAWEPECLIAAHAA